LVREGTADESGSALPRQPGVVDHLDVHELDLLQPSLVPDVGRLAVEASVCRPLGVELYAAIRDVRAGMSVANCGIRTASVSDRRTLRWLQRAPPIGWSN
jgi:hypothetical protein